MQEPKLYQIVDAILNYYKTFQLFSSLNKYIDYLVLFV